MKYAPRSTGSTYQTKNGTWVFAITVGTDGAGRRKRRTVSAKTATALAEKRAALMEELYKSSTRPGRVTVETWAHRWLEDIAPDRQRPRTLANSTSNVRKHIIPTLGAYKLHEVGPEEVRELTAAVIASGCSSRTSQIVFSTFSVMMQAAVDEGLIDSNPCKRMSRPKATSKKRGALTIMEARRVIVTALDAGDPRATLWASALLLGCRKAELIGLEWERVDLGMRLIDLSWQIQSVAWQHGAGCRCKDGVSPELCPLRQHKIKEGEEMREAYLSRVFLRPKTTAGLRLLPIPEPLAVLLDALPGERRGLVWHEPDGRPLTDKGVKAGWDAALERAGVPPIDMHSARHTTASLLQEARVHPEVIRQILGHSDQVATRIYTHISTTQASEAMNAMAGMLHLPGGAQSLDERSDGFQLGLGEPFK